MSDKVHTTRTFAQAITNRNNSQIIAFDTPGLVTKKEMKKFKLDEKFVSSCRHSIQNSDIIGVVQDVSNHWTRNALNPLIRNLLEEFRQTPSFLILNKIDKLHSKRSLLELVRILTCNNISLDKKKSKTKEIGNEESQLTDKDVEREKTDNDAGWPEFKRVFMVSSLNGNGIEQVAEFIESYAVEKPWVFKNNEVTDQAPSELIERLVRARLLDYLPQEIPYNLSVELEYLSTEQEKIVASVNIKCPNRRHEKLLCGYYDGKLRQITDRITSDMIQCFKLPVTLTLSTSAVEKH